MSGTSRITWLFGLPIACLAMPGALHAQCGALKFDGVDDVASALDTNDDFDLGDALTLEVWVRVDVLQSGGGFIGGFTAGGGGAWLMGSGISNPADAVLGASTPSTDSVFAMNALVPGTWTHVAGTFDGTTLEIYIDGNMSATHVHGTPGTTSDVVSIVLGMFPVMGSGLFFNGTMDDVRLWNVVRTPDQIQASYMQTLVGDEPGLVGYYRFDEGSGDVILDSSIFGNDGYLGATPGPGADDPMRVAGLQFLCSAGSPYCFGDGSGTACPCGNPGGAGQGCANSSGAGGLLESSGSASAGADDLAFSASNLLSGQPGLLFVGQNAINGGNGNLFGDGLRCAGQNVVRLGVQVPDAAGNASWGPGLGAAGGWSSGDVRYFQCWYRDPSGGPCGAGFNLSNGIEVDFTP